MRRPIRTRNALRRRGAGPRAGCGAHMMEKRRLAIGDGCRLAWRFDGPVGAPVLLLSNSLGTTMEMWAPQIRGVGAPVQRASLRQPGPWRLRCACRCVFDGSVGTRRRRTARRAGSGSRAFLRAFHGRDGGAMARRSRAGPPRSARARQHFRLYGTAVRMAGAN